MTLHLRRENLQVYVFDLNFLCIASRNVMDSRSPPRPAQALPVNFDPSHAFTLRNSHRTNAIVRHAQTKVRADPAKRDLNDPRRSSRGMHN